jgi:hypothetical protein
MSRLPLELIEDLSWKDPLPVLSVTEDYMDEFKSCEDSIVILEACQRPKIHSPLHELAVGQHWHHVHQNIYNRSKVRLV